MTTTGTAGELTGTNAGTDGKTCFVISPIGTEGSDVREHADAVFDYIITPAMQECGIRAFRGDHMEKLGKISEQMFHSILHDDLCIAVLTFNNPNVFYELAIAQAAARPVIILIEKGHSLPFDIQDLRCVPYDLKPRPLFEKEYVKRIVGYVRDLEAAGWKVPCPIPGLPVADARQGRRDCLLVERYREYEPRHGWMHLLEETREAFDLMGTSLTTFRRQKGFRDLLLKKAADGCKVRVLMLHPDNPVFGLVRDPALAEEGLSQTVSRIAEGWAYYSEMARQSPNVQVREMRRGCPHCQMTRTDQYAVVTPYLYSETTSYCPLMRFPRATGFYPMFAQEFESLWRANAPA